jgi:hypothetical protein
VQHYYESLKGKEDLKTNACCIGELKVSKKQKAVLSKLHEEVLSKFYGCGTPVPPDLQEGLVVLDLGCGTGRDVFLVSALVGI